MCTCIKRFAAAAAAFAAVATFLSSNKWNSLYNAIFYEFFHQHNNNKYNMRRAKLQRLWHILLW